LNKFREISINKELIFSAKEEAKSLTQKLEELDPSAAYIGTELADLDAFERQLLRFGIIPRTDAKLGVKSSQMNAWFQSPNTDLKLLFPEFIDRVISEEQMKNSILPYLIAMDVPITGNTYRGTFLDDAPLNQKRKPIPVGAPLTRAKLDLRDKAVNINKFGLAIEAPYETTRWMTVDELALWVKRVALQNALDESEAAIDTIVNGDGNKNTAATIYKMKADLNSDATAGTLDFKSWLRFASKFRPYKVTTLVGGEIAITDFLSMQFPSVDPVKLLALIREGQENTMRVKLGTNLYGDVSLWITDHADFASAKKLIGIDQNFALKRIHETGSAIQENARYIERQTEILTVSENAGFSVIFANASKILDYST
jgi:hypothetical protein